METWVEADIEGYMVSSEGRLAKLMALTPSKNGYVQLGVPEFSGAKKRIRRYLHDLVLTAFAGPRPAWAVARHLNDIRTDNRIENLVWGSRSENQWDAFRNGKRSRKNQCPYGHPLKAPNLRNDGGNRCLACNRARARARHHGVPVTQELRDLVYKEVIS